MNRKPAAALVVVLGVAVLTALVAHAQETPADPIGTVGETTQPGMEASPEELERAEDVSPEEMEEPTGRGTGISEPGDEPLGEAGRLEEPSLEALGGDVATVADVASDARISRTVSRGVNLDRENVLLGIALANNAGQPLQIADLADMRAVVRESRAVDRQIDYDEETAFAALALGYNARGSSLEGISAAASVDRVVGSEKRIDQRVNLDRDTVLFGIALANAIGADLNLGDVADVSRTTQVRSSASQELDIDETDAFLSLALGHSGAGAFGGELAQT